MKKFFSLFAAVLFAGSMMAESVTLTMSDFAATSFTDQTSGISVATAKNSGSTEPAYNSNGADLRVYAKGSITISASKNITAISFTISTAGKKRLAPLTASVGEVAVAGTPGFTAEWTGSATSVTLTVGDKADYGTDGNTKAGQLDFTAMVVTLEDGDAPADPVIEYYVVGTMNNWELSADYKLAANPAQAGEYMKRFTFAANDELKVRKAIDGELDAWYPEGVGNNWVITEDGQYDVYFRPEGNTEWANGFFFVAPYVIPQYEVAEAIAAGLTNGTEIKVRGVVSKIEIKGKNFASYGSACIYVNDATGAEGQFEFYNCYAVGSAKFTTTDPAYDATSTAWAQLTEVATADGYAIHVGDTVIAQGKYKLYNTTYELDQNCFIIYSKAPDAEFPTAIDNTNIDAKAVKFFENGQLIIIKNGVRYNAQGAVVR